MTSLYILLLTFAQVGSSYLSFDVRVSKIGAACMHPVCIDPSINLTILVGQGLSSYQIPLDVDDYTQQITVMNEEVPFHCVINSPDPTYKSLLRACDQSFSGVVNSNESLFDIAGCYRLKMQTVSRLGLNDMMNVALSLEWWVLIPTVVSMTGLMLALVGCWIQRRRVRSFRVLFEEHLIQTASSHQNTCSFNS